MGFGRICILLVYYEKKNSPESHTALGVFYRIETAYALF